MSAQAQPAVVVEKPRSAAARHVRLPIPGRSAVLFVLAAYLASYFLPAHQGADRTTTGRYALEAYTAMVERGLSLQAVAGWPSVQWLKDHLPSGWEPGWLPVGWLLGWLPNPLLWVGAVLLANKAWRGAALCGGAALLLGLYWLHLLWLPLFPEQTEAGTLRPGYAVWMASMALLAGSALVLRRRAATISGAALAHLRGRERLEKLDLSFTSITDAGLQSLDGLTDLLTLDLSDTPITDDGLRFLKGLPRLHTLNLSGTAVGDAGLEQLREMTHLRELILNETKVSDAGLAHLKTLPELAKLHLCFTMVAPAITAAGVSDLQKALPELHILTNL